MLVAVRLAEDETTGAGQCERRSHPELTLLAVGRCGQVTRSRVEAVVFGDDRHRRGRGHGRRGSDLVLDRRPLTVRTRRASVLTSTGRIGELRRVRRRRTALRRAGLLQASHSRDAGWWRRRDRTNGGDWRRGGAWLLIRGQSVVSLAPGPLRRLLSRRRAVELSRWLRWLDDDRRRSSSRLDRLAKALRLRDRDDAFCRASVRRRGGALRIDAIRRSLTWRRRFGSQSSLLLLLLLSRRRRRRRLLLRARIVLRILDLARVEHVNHRRVVLTLRGVALTAENVDAAAPGRHRVS